MKIKDGYILQEIAGSHIVISIKKDADHFDGIVQLNNVGALLWKEIEKTSCTKNDLVNIIIQKYNIDLETALHDVSVFLNVLHTKGFLEQ